MKQEVGVPCASLLTMFSKTKMAWGSGFCRDDIFALLDLIGEMVTTDMDEWAAIERRHEVSFCGQNQTKEGLRQSFKPFTLSKSQLEIRHAHQKFERKNNCNMLFPAPVPNPLQKVQWMRNSI